MKKELNYAKRDYPLPSLYSALSLGSRKNHQKTAAIKNILNQKSHLFIVVLGAVIGAILSIFIAYHLNYNPLSYTLISVIPFALAYSLRKVYIHTLVHSQE